MTRLIQPDETGKTGADAGSTNRNFGVEQEADHRIANSLAMLASLGRLQAKHLKEGDKAITAQQAGCLLRDYAAQIEGISLLHRLLARRPGAGKLDLGDYLQQLCAALQSTFSFAGQVQCAGPGAIAQLLPAEQVRAIAMIVCELVTNAIKYAHPTGVPGSIEISFGRAGDSLLIEVADDGVGLPEGFDPAAGGNMGFNLLRHLSGTIGAELSFESSGIGLQARLTVPL